jgi:hypothetical protein
MGRHVLGYVREVNEEDMKRTDKTGSADARPSVARDLRNATTTLFAHRWHQLPQINALRPNASAQCWDIRPFR